MDATLKKTLLASFPTLSWCLPSPASPQREAKLTDPEVGVLQQSSIGFIET